METIASPRGERERLIGFLHIPKTGGTTLNAMLSEQFLPEQRYEVMMRGMNWMVPKRRLFARPLISHSKLRRLRNALEPRHDVRLLHGHFDLSIRGLLPDDVRLFTMLRDPLDRAISHYFHYRRRSDDRIHPLAMRSSLVEWVRARGLVEMDNGQTRRLAGLMNVPCGALTRAALDVAKSNLARFAVVGLTERFDESLLLLHRAFGWPLRRLHPCNVGENRPARDAFAGDAAKQIAEHNALDMELYGCARELLERALRGAPVAPASSARAAVPA